MSQTFTFGFSSEDIDEDDGAAQGNGQPTAVDQAEQLRNPPKLHTLDELVSGGSIKVVPCYHHDLICCSCALYQITVPDTNWKSYSGDPNEGTEISIAYFPSLRVIP